MRFSRLRLNGFKSFVDPTDLVIVDGLTGVVGPNGCGKSNLLEALRWVMGENRPTAMRGDGMEDVIFAGTASRPARNFAEVSLTIDNQDRLAPAEFNTADALEIVRRITRDAGSAYKLNGRDVRARDVQMLFADASTGAHSPALVRQGQISELINAKPRNRRRVLEEAAGISGLYQRRHEAELKLQGTEGNLARVQDVIEQLAAQLVQLARQARQAARYREIGQELRQAEGLLLYRRWREAETAHADAQANLAESMRSASRAEAAAIAATLARQSAEEALPPHREEAVIASAITQRLEAQRETLNAEDARAAAQIAALAAQITQLQRDAEREEALNRDAGETLARLAGEATQLALAQEGHDSRLADAAEAARAAAADLGAHEQAQSLRSEDVARLAARHQSAQRLLDEVTAQLTRNQAEYALAGSAAQDAEVALTRANGEHTEAAARLVQAELAATAAEDALVQAEAARAETQTREADARAARSAAEGEANALRAEAGALAKLVAREANAGAQILDQIAVTPGYEQALGAALADDLRAPEVDGDVASGWVGLADYVAPQTLPTGVEPLSAHVQGAAVLARRLGQIGLVDADVGAGLQPSLLPGQRLVSLDGDLWRWDGFRASAEDAPSAAALRLRQLNRLSALKNDLAEVEERSQGTRQAHEMLTARLAELSAADQAARSARRLADQQVTEAQRALSRAEADQSVATAKRDVARQSQARFAQEAGTAEGRVADARAALIGLPDLGQARAEIETQRAYVENARQAMLTRRSSHEDLRREGEARMRRCQEITKEETTWQARLKTAEARKAELSARRAETEADLANASAHPGEIAQKRVALEKEIDAATARGRKAQDALAMAETALQAATQAERAAERDGSEARELRAGAQARAEAAMLLRDQAVARIMELAEMTPPALLETLGGVPDDLAPSDQLEAWVNRLKRQREALGAVNLRAEEDALDVQSEHDTLAREKADLEEAIKKLRSGIAGLNREGRERLLTAFEQVNGNFTRLFTHLFGGGEARLVMVDSDDPLEAGLEILCQPPGKKLSTLSLLSGGEQTLTALALIFGVFLANPAPICVLDEVDAPLDDANVTRFCDLMDEMTRQTETRFLVITHHAVTMSRMDRLFGVTMGEQGVSQLVSVDLKRAAAMVA